MSNLFTTRSDGDSMCVIVLRYGGYWRIIPSTSRSKYEGGRQKTVRVERDKTSLKTFGEIIAIFCEWVRGRLMKLSYVRPGITPREFIAIRSNVDFITMLNLYGDAPIKMFMVTEESRFSSMNYSRGRRTSSRNISSRRMSRVEVMECSDNEQIENVELDDRYVALNEDDMAEEGNISSVIFFYNFVSSYNISSVLMLLCIFFYHCRSRNT